MCKSIVYCGSWFVFFLCFFVSKNRKFWAVIWLEVRILQLTSEWKLKKHANRWVEFFFFFKLIPLLGKALECWVYRLKRNVFTESAAPTQFIFRLMALISKHNWIILDKKRVSCVWRTKNKNKKHQNTYIWLVFLWIRGLKPFCPK